MVIARFTVILRDVGEQCGQNRVYRLMRAAGLRTQVGYRRLERLHPLHERSVHTAEFRAPLVKRRLFSSHFSLLITVEKVDANMKKSIGGARYLCLENSY